MSRSPGYALARNPHQQFKKFSLKPRDIDCRKASLLIGQPRSFELVIGCGWGQADRQNSGLPRSTPLASIPPIGNLTLSRATTKSGTQSRARLNSESGSEASALRLCSGIAISHAHRIFHRTVARQYLLYLLAAHILKTAVVQNPLDRIAVPTLLLHACDDPFIRFTAETRAKIAANPHITLLETAHGGHCAFLATRSPGNDGYWAEHTALQFVLAHA